MTRRGFTGLAAATALLALAGWIPGAAPGASAQPGGHGKGKAVGKAEQAPAEAARGVGKAKAAAGAAAEEAEAEAGKGKPEGVGKPEDKGKPETAGEVAKKPETPDTPEVAAVKERIRKEQHKHLKNLARINRVFDVAKENGKADLAEKAGTLRKKEYARHQRVIDRLQQERRRLLGDPGQERPETRNAGKAVEGEAPAVDAPKAGGPKTE